MQNKNSEIRPADESPKSIVELCGLIEGQTDELEKTISTLFNKLSVLTENQLPEILAADKYSAKSVLGEWMSNTEYHIRQNSLKLQWLLLALDLK